MTTDEAEKQKEQAQDPEPSPPQEAPAGHAPGSPRDDPQPKPRSRTPAGRGLSRLLSSLLKRSSGCPEGEGLEAERADRDRAGQEGAELKAPIADPEPELRIEGDPTLDQHSLSSGEIQLGPDPKVKEEEAEEEEEEGEGEKVEEVEREEEEEAEEGVEEQEEGRGEKPEREQAEEEQEAAEDPKSPAPQRRSRVMHCKVTLLDDTLYECELEKHAKGQDLFVKVCDHLNLLERDYYGLAIWETPSKKVWLDLTKEVRRQVQGSSCDFTFNVKFYPPDPAHLTEDITRYFLVLQLRKDIQSGRLPCSFVTLALLGSYALQSELGEYDPDLHSNDYAKELRLAPGQTKELEEKMMELHRTYKAMTPAQADLMFLENAKKLAMYGVDLHQAKDLDGVDIMLGVSSGGLMVFKDKLRINRFPWPKVLKISYKRSGFFIKIRPSELEHYESTIGFKLPNYKASKKLWKVCVEHHTFFRLTSTEVATTPRRFLALGSKFRYSGRTQAQTRQASSMIDRPAPMFQRSSSKRASRSLDGAVVVTPDKSARPVSAPLISPAPSGGEAAPAPGPAPVTTATPRTRRRDPGTPSRRAPRSEERKAERKAEAKAEGRAERSARAEPRSEVKAVARRERRHAQMVTAANGERKSQSPRQGTDPTRRKKRSKKTEADTIYIRHSNLMLEDLDRTQEGIMRHHSSISELKRSFMEAVPEPRPSEWDKRLSTNSPFRTASINGQLQPGAGGPPLVKTQTITISDVTNAVRGDVSTPTREVPVVHTETKTITYEAAQPLESLTDRDSGVLLSAQTITSETVSTTTTTQITKTVRGGISETRIEKRIVITGDTEIDHDQALAQAIKEAKEQHPDMSVTRVVVHQETEITPQ
ncbi:protein 4.1-like isoform X1 [Anguilla anguilla]|uniref:protein 4.1-like isoform X1 n=1 Tax=Anguilla anguilla TaxID=7936 RepID=UPI0015AC9753|nr:protein 4.1-like isoform X1 [Anguilla anguilla]XP_035287210.1 protein 4.1-like isoform X1 [Anguilla anguilla]